ncbi:MAG: DUF1080 domain-containing protein, partial [Ginsengibacter sp.]
MKLKQLVLLLLLLPYMAGIAQQKRKWKQLFNGKNLDGWIVKIKGHELDDNFGNTFRVVDGKMVVSYDQYDSF